MAASVDDEFPKNIEGYDISGRLGQGAFGSVYKGYCIPKNQDVAIKILSDLSTEQDFNLFVSEAKLMATLRHENTLQLLGCFLYESECWIVMPLLCASCGDLLQHPKFQNGLEERLIARIIKDICDGLEYIHKQSIVHRDIKPSNILLDCNGFAKLADFGVSSNLVHAFTKKVKTRFAGTLSFAAPEVCVAYLSGSGKNSEGYDQKADIWSLGMTCIQLFEARSPFSNCQTDEEIATQITEGLFDVNSVFTKDVRRVFKQFVTLCCTFEKTNRPAAKVLKEHTFVIPDTGPLIERSELVEELELSLENNFYSKRLQTHLLPESKRPATSGGDIADESVTEADQNSMTNIDWNFNQTVNSETNLKEVVKMAANEVSKKRPQISSFVECFGESDTLGQVVFFEGDTYTIKLQNGTTVPVESSNVRKSYLEEVYEGLSQLNNSRPILLREFLFLMNVPDLEDDIGTQVGDLVQNIRENPNTMKHYTALVNIFLGWKKRKRNAGDVKPKNSKDQN